MNTNRMLWLGATLFLLVIVVANSFFIIAPGERGIIIRLGQIRREIYTPGIHFKIPLIDAGRTMNVQTQKTETQSESSSRDLQIVNVTIALNYNLDPAKVRDLYQNVGLLPIVESRLIDPAIHESIKAATAMFTAEQLITKRQEVSQEIIKNLKKKLEKDGINIVDINIVNYNFSEEFNKAIENKVKAEQEALAEKNKLEKIKFQAQQKIESAKADAESIRIQAEAIKAQGGAEYVQLQRINKRDGKLPSTMLGDKSSVLMNIDPTK